MRSGVFALTVMSALLCVDGRSGAEESDAVSVISAMIDAFNEHDLERALSYFSDDFVLTLRPAYPSLEDRSDSGRDFTRKWAKELIDGDFRIEIAVKKVEGNKVQTETRSWQNITRRLGIAPVLGIEDYVVERGKITRLTWTSSDETRQKVIALRKKFFIAVAVALVLLIALVWRAVHRIRRRRRARKQG